MYSLYAPCSFSLARFCWGHSEFKRDNDDAKPIIAGVNPAENSSTEERKVSGVFSRLQSRQETFPEDTGQGALCLMQIVCAFCVSH